jgi:hypothetical protein
MLPVYVERKRQGKTGSLSWWLPVKMDGADRVQKKIDAPDTDNWNKQMYRVCVFDELVYDTDPNLINVLIGEDWTSGASISAAPSARARTCAGRKIW